MSRRGRNFQILKHLIAVVRLSYCELRCAINSCHNKMQFKKLPINTNGLLSGEGNVF